MANNGDPRDPGNWRDGDDMSQYEKKLDLDALLKRAMNAEAGYMSCAVVALINRIRELEERSERQSTLLRDQTDRIGAANLRVIELERASQPGADALAAAMHDAAIRYANGHTVDFQHEAREVVMVSGCDANALPKDLIEDAVEAVRIVLVNGWGADYASKVLKTILNVGMTGKVPQPGEVGYLAAMLRAGEEPRKCAKCGRVLMAYELNCLKCRVETYYPRAAIDAARAALDGPKEG